MGLSWRDSVTTVLAGAVALVGLAVAGSWGWPMLGSPRTGCLAVLILGIGMCAASQPAGTDQPGRRDHGPAVAVLSILGVVSLVLAVAGLISGSDLAFASLVTVTLAMWLLATVRHAARSLTNTPAGQTST